MKQDIIYGKKTISFPLEMIDLKKFVEVHRNDKSGYMCRYCLKYMTEQEGYNYILALLQTRQIYVWTVMTKEHKPRFCGFIYLSDVTDYSASISGIMDSQFARGITKEIKKDTYTYSQDSVMSLAKFCFEVLGFNRLEMDVVEDNRRGIALAQKCGFHREGCMRQALKLDEKFKNVVFLSMLKEEFRNE